MARGEEGKRENGCGLFYELKKLMLMKMCIFGMIYKDIGVCVCVCMCVCPLWFNLTS